MRIWLVFFLCIWSASCRTTPQSPLPQDSALPMTRIEGKNAACELGDGNSSKLCSCIASELYEYGQSNYFKKEVATSVMCEHSETPRQDAINTHRYYAVRICKKLSIPSVQPDYCWDGSIINTTSYPCAKCPPEPTP
jgi:hypothetical protein